MNERLQPGLKAIKYGQIRDLHRARGLLEARAVTPITCLHASCVAMLVVLSACAGTVVTTPRSRVAQDLGCTTDGTSVEEIGQVPGEKAARWQVTGCGRTAVYICTTPVRDCWREGDVGPRSSK